MIARALIPSMALAFALAPPGQGGALAAHEVVESDSPDITFTCHVVSFEGEQREINGLVADFERVSSGSQKPQMSRNAQVTDGGATRSTQIPVVLGAQGFEITFEERTSDKSSPDFVHPAGNTFQSYDFRWLGYGRENAVVTLKKWTELRPAVKMKLTPTAAGPCTIKANGAES